MTEDEAKTRWCPFARVTDPHRTLNKAWNRVDSRSGAAPFLSPPPALCIGSACMAWRRDLDGADDTKVGWGTNGYCGLAGRPT